MSYSTHQSYFRHSVGRPYPYRWFTWVVVLGGFMATAVFTAANIAANGYDTTLVSVTNPNETESSSWWFLRSPWSLLSKVSPRCHDQVFTLGSDIHTSISPHRPYEILGLSNLTSSEGQDKKTLAYHNSAFQDCYLETFDLSFGLHPTANNNSRGAYTLGYDATLNCTVFENGTPISMILSVDIGSVDLGDDYSTQDVDDLSYRGSWASQLKLDIRSNLIDIMRGPEDSSDYHGFSSCTSSKSVYSNEHMMRCSLEISRNDVMTSVASGSKDGSDGTFSTSMWMNSSGPEAIQHYWRNPGMDDANDNSTNWGPKASRLQPIFLLEDLARLLYSDVMTDFGWFPTTNILARQRNLWDFLNRTNMVIEEACCYHEYYEPHTILSGILGYHDAVAYEFNENTSQDYLQLFEQANLTLPDVGASYINTLYLCEIPKMKPIGSMLISILVADFVLLQVTWTVFTLIVDFFMERRDPTSNYCSGCAKMMSYEEKTSEDVGDSYMSGINFENSISTDEEPPRQRQPSASADVIEFENLIPLEDNHYGRQALTQGLNTDPPPMSIVTFLNTI